MSCGNCKSEQEKYAELQAVIEEYRNVIKELGIRK